MGQIKITGYAEKKYTADIIEYSIVFYGSDAKLDKALERAKHSCEIFLTKLSELGMNINDIELQRNNLSEDHYRDRELKTASISITFRRIFSAKFHNVINEIIRSNGLNVHLSIDFYLSKTIEKGNELLREAILDSKTKADIIASTNGQIIKGMEYVQDTKFRDDFDEEPKPLSGPIGDVRLDNFSQSSIMDNLKAKEITLSQTVYVSWLVE